jgi:hypothetical protein
LNKSLRINKFSFKNQKRKLALSKIMTLNKLKNNQKKIFSFLHFLNCSSFFFIFFKFIYLQFVFNLSSNFDFSRVLVLIFSMRLLKKKEKKKNQFRFLVLKDKVNRKNKLGKKIFKNPDSFFSLAKLLNNIILFCLKKLILILKQV